MNLSCACCAQPVADAQWHVVLTRNVERQVTSGFVVEQDESDVVVVVWHNACAPSARDLAATLTGLSPRGTS